MTRNCLFFGRGGTALVASMWLPHAELVSQQARAGLAKQESPRVSLYNCVPMQQTCANSILGCNLRHSARCPPLHAQQGKSGPPSQQPSRHHPPPPSRPSLSTPSHHASAGIPPEQAGHFLASRRSSSPVYWHLPPPPHSLRGGGSGGLLLPFTGVQGESSLHS